MPSLDIDEVRLPRVNNQVKGFAYVQLADRKVVSHVVSVANKTRLEGRTINVEVSQSGGQAGYTVHVSNLSYKVSEEAELRERFEEYGQVKRVHVVKEGGRTKGFAFVEFVEREAMERAVK